MLQQINEEQTEKLILQMASLSLDMLHWRAKSQILVRQFSTIEWPSKETYLGISQIPSLTFFEFFDTLSELIDSEIMQSFLNLSAQLSLYEGDSQ